MTWPHFVSAQHAGKIPRVGILLFNSPQTDPIGPLIQGLGELGYIDGKNIFLEYRYAEGKRDDALAAMSKAADAEDKTEKHPVTPGVPKPARELYGDMLLESGRPADALAEYEASQIRDPKRFRGFWGAGQAAAQAGNKDKAHYHFTKLVEMAGSADPRPELATARDYLAKN